MTSGYLMREGDSINLGGTPMEFRMKPEIALPDSGGDLIEWSKVAPDADEIAIIHTDGCQLFGL